MSIREVSKSQYSKTYSHLVKAVGSTDLDKILTYIKGKDVKIATKFNYLNSIVSLKKNDPTAVTGNVDEIRKERELLRAEINETLGKNNITERQRVVLDKVKRSDIETLMVTLASSKDTSLKDLEDYILLHLMFPDTMRNDLADVVIIRRKDGLGKFNAIYIPTKKDTQGVIKIVDHKTSSTKSGKPIIRELTVQLTNDIKQFVKLSNLVGVQRKYLFQDREGKGFTSSAFTHKFKRLFKRHLDIPFAATTLRKIFWSDHSEKIKIIDEQLQDMHRSADNMGHTFTTAKKYYADNTSPKLNRTP